MDYTRIYAGPKSRVVIARGQGNREYATLAVPLESIPEVIEGLLSAMAEHGHRGTSGNPIEDQPLLVLEIPDE